MGLRDTVPGSGRPAEISEIDISASGWEIELDFEDLNDGKTLQDYNTLRELEALGMMQFEYDKDTKILTLSHVKGCQEKQIPELYIDVMMKYNPRPVIGKDSILPATMESLPIASGRRSLKSSPLIAEIIHPATPHVDTLINVTPSSRPPPEFTREIFPKDASTLHAADNSPAANTLQAPVLDQKEIKNPGRIVVRLPADIVRLEAIFAAISNDERRYESTKDIRLRLREIAANEQWLFSFKNTREAEIIELKKDKKPAKGKKHFPPLPETLDFLNKLPHERFVE